jgi:hypothetical protein
MLVIVADVTARSARSAAPCPSRTTQLFLPSVHDLDVVPIAGLIQCKRILRAQQM